MLIEELKHKAIRGVVALTGRTLLLQVFNQIGFILLSLYLLPSDIGTFIAVSAFRDILGLFTDTGLGAALIQKKEELDHLDLSSTFVLQEILVIIVAGAGFLLTQPAVRILSLDKAGMYLYWSLLLVLLINSLKVIPSIVLERRLAFEKQVLPAILEAAIFNIVAVALAWRGFGLYSYAPALILSSLFGLAAYYFVSPWRPSLHFSWEKASRLISFGFQFQSKSYLSVIKDQLLTIFLARNIGSSGLGYWGWGQRWAYSPLRFIVDSVNKVTFPAYSRVQHDNTALRVGIEKSLLGVSLILFPVLALMVILVPGLVQLIPKYHKWDPALISFYILCVQGAISGISNILINALDATGRVKTTLKFMLIWIFLTWIFTIILIPRFGFTGIAIAQLLVSLTIVFTVIVLKRVINFTFFGNIITATIGAVGAVLVGLILRYLMPINYLSLGLQGFVSLLTYLFLVWLISGKELKENLAIITRVYKKVL